MQTVESSTFYVDPNRPQCKMITIKAKCKMFTFCFGISNAKCKMYFFSFHFYILHCNTRLTMCFGMSIHPVKGNCFVEARVKVGKEVEVVCTK